MAERTCTEREIAAVLERAVERPEEADRTAPEAGLTLSERERPAQEAPTRRARSRS